MRNPHNNEIEFHKDTISQARRAALALLATRREYRKNARIDPARQPCAEEVRSLVREQVTLCRQMIADARAKIASLQVPA